MLTYLPFFWLPAEHMYLKPEKTVDFATRVGHPFAEEYEPDPSAAVYRSLLELASVTAARVASLHPTAGSTYKASSGSLVTTAKRSFRT